MVGQICFLLLGILASHAVTAAKAEEGQTWPLEVHRCPYDQKAQHEETLKKDDEYQPNFTSRIVETQVYQKSFPRVGEPSNRKRSDLHPETGW